MKITLYDSLAGDDTFFLADMTLFKVIEDMRYCHTEGLEGHSPHEREWSECVGCYFENDLNGCFNRINHPDATAQSGERGLNEKA